MISQLLGCLTTVLWMVLVDAGGLEEPMVWDQHNGTDIYFQSHRPELPVLFAGGPWPEEAFGLPKPKTGCPDGWFWFSGSRNEVLSVFGHGVRCLQSSCNFFGSEAWRYSMTKTYYCVKKHPETRWPWPKGSYCIHRYLGQCPPGFQEGFITFDDHNQAAEENTVLGFIPDGRFDSDTVFIYCCRSDGDPETAMSLPVSKPFYLYRYKGRCQEVKDMMVTPEDVVYETWRGMFLNRNIDHANGSHPDASVNSIILHYCYYRNWPGFDV